MFIFDQALELWQHLLTTLVHHPWLMLIPMVPLSILEFIEYRKNKRYR